MIDKSIGQLVREAIDNDDGETTSSRYVSFKMRDDIDTTEAYLNSKHTSGETDYLGREKPFFNIVVGARNIWFRATDLDVKNITVIATKIADNIMAFMASLLLQKWMRKVNFGKFLNKWGLSLANHGSSISKFIEKDGQLHCEVMDWNNMLVDAVDFDNNIKIQKLWLTQAQLKKNKSYNQELVKKLLDDLTTRKTTKDQQKDNKSGYIELYELHGELPLSYITNDDKDEDTYVQQMHTLTLLESEKNKGEYDEYCLYSGKEDKDPFMITHLIEKDGQTYAGGAVKNLFQAQWMVNHNEKVIKDQLDLASKIVFQTSDELYVGRNVLSNIETGDILTHKINQPLTQLNNKADISAILANKNDWQAIGNQINGISEAMQGQNAPSGTAWRQVQALLQESHSLFEIMVENKGLYLVDMMTEYIIPFVKKQMDNTDEIAEILEDYQIEWIDSKYIPNKAIKKSNQKIKDIILNGETPTEEMQMMDIEQNKMDIKGELSQMGNQRFIKPSDIDGTTWKAVLKDIQWELSYNITGENKDIQGSLATLNTLLQIIANPATAQVIQTPEGKLIVNKILSLTGEVSPVELSQLQKPTAQPLPQPAMAEQPVGAELK